MPRQRAAFQGEDAVLARLAPGDAQFVDDLLRHPVGTLHVAGRAQADVDHELAARLEAEEMIEAGHAGHLGRRHLQQLGHGVEMGAAEIAELRLHLVQHGDELALRVRLGPIGVDGSDDRLAQDQPGGGLDSSSCRCRCSRDPSLEM